MQQSTETKPWERDLVERLALQALTEQRRARRWRIFFRFLLVAYIGFLTITYFGFGSGLTQVGTPKHVARVDFVGPISSDKVTAEQLVNNLRSAVNAESSVGVVLYIDSPGGSPVHAGIVYDEILRLRALHPDKPIVSVIGDICASGGYYVAAATQEIYANQSSIVGSIGVRAGGFGFVGTMQKLGVERRLITSGDHKALLDPFAPSDPEEVAHFRELVGEIHEQFKTAVRDGRGERLNDSDELFSGLVYTGVKAQDLGLVDGLMSVDEVARSVFDTPEVITYDAQSLIDSVAKRIGVAFSAALPSMGLSWH